MRAEGCGRAGRDGARALGGVNVGPEPQSGDTNGNENVEDEPNGNLQHTGKENPPIALSTLLDPIRNIKYSFCWTHKRVALAGGCDRSAEYFLKHRRQRGQSAPWASGIHIPTIAIKYNFHGVSRVRFVSVDGARSVLGAVRKRSCRNCGLYEIFEQKLECLKNTSVFLGVSQQSMLALIIFLEPEDSRYEVDHVTRTASWLPPAEGWADAAGALPYGWEPALDSRGQPYYIK
ncbi:hypothetical protein EVAR_25440_1 [Eumeta japonica]|uniref:WW domain-containing protein n=1 Tax=Eumeta variegata TaxID=151549 RepID=A0A4C1VMN5_EUMVA|nr:hypothetical protein EVAR_25440_1 [Eumeta japonica]